MERADWLKQMRSFSEALYDQVSPRYWVTFGFYENEAHRAYLQKFLARVRKGGTILSAACGAGRYDGFMIDAGHSVVGIDQSAGMLARAREHFPQEQFPQLRYEKVGLQEMAQVPAFHEAFDGVTCMDAMEHVCPEDWPGIVQGFAKVLKPGGVLYFTAEVPDAEDVAASYERAKAMGLPVVYGEVADEVAASHERLKASGQPGSGQAADVAVYHYYPSPEQVQAWLDHAGLKIEEEGTGSGYRHIISSKR